MAVEFQAPSWTCWIASAILAGAPGCSELAPAPAGGDVPQSVEPRSETSQPEAWFIVPDGFEGTVYVLWDPVLGGAPELAEHVRTYRFDSSGVLRIRLHADADPGRLPIVAFQENGRRLLVDWDGNSGSRGLVPVSYWHVAATEARLRSVTLERREGPSDPHDLLEQLGHENLIWTPEHERLADLDPEIRERNSRSRLFRLLAREPSAQPQVRIIVPDGYSDRVWVVADPARGIDPASVNYECPIQDNGVLRLRMEGPAFRALADPLVFNRSGQQLWLRRMHSVTGGTDMKPAIEYLVCLDGEYRKPVECEHGYVGLALQALGETDLEPVEANPAALLQLLAPGVDSVTDNHHEQSAACAQCRTNEECPACKKP